MIKEPAKPAAVKNEKENDETQNTVWLGNLF